MNPHRRFPRFLGLVTLIVTSCLWAATASAQVPGRTLIAANLDAAQLGMVTVEGEGFTPGGAVRLVMHELWDAGPSVDHWVVTTGGELDESLAYLTAGLHGPTRAEATLLTPITIHYMPPSDIDPALGYASSNVVWAGGCPDLVVQAWDAETDTWSNQIGIDLAGC